MANGTIWPFGGNETNVGYDMILHKISRYDNDTIQYSPRTLRCMSTVQD